MRHLAALEAPTPHAYFTRNWQGYGSWEVYAMQDLFLRSTDTFVYLIHFDRPLVRSTGVKVLHYIGSTKDLDRRLLQEHRRKEKKGGAPLLRRANQLGIGWQVAKIWQARREFEFLLKKQRNHRRFCPVCLAAQRGAEMPF
jgi:predicted GIY-YIG superfamily endonuclease